MQHCSIYTRLLNIKLVHVLYIEFKQNRSQLILNNQALMLLIINFLTATVKDLHNDIITFIIFITFNSQFTWNVNSTQGQRNKNHEWCTEATRLEINFLIHIYLYFLIELRNGNYDTHLMCVYSLFKQVKTNKIQQSKYLLR